MAFILYNCKSPFKIECARVVTIFLPVKVYEELFRRSREANSTVHGWIWSNVEHKRDFMFVLITCKNEKDPVKNEGATVLRPILVIFKVFA